MRRTSLLSATSDARTERLTSMRLRSLGDADPHEREAADSDIGPKRPSRKCRRISPGIVPSTSIGHLTMQVYPQCLVRPGAAGVVRYNGLCRAADQGDRKSVV